MALPFVKYKTAYFVMAKPWETGDTGAEGVYPNCMIPADVTPDETGFVCYEALAPSEAFYVTKEIFDANLTSTFG